MEINKFIDSTLLKPEATPDAVTHLCKEALEHAFAAVCVNSYHTRLVSGLLAGSGVKTCIVVGFPLGASLTAVKVFEAQRALDEGAQELDVVMNIGAFKSGEHFAVLDDIKAVVEACSGRALVKVIIECSLLTDAEKVRACKLVMTTGADFVKTSTGFSTGGATIEDVMLLAKTAKGRVKVKASGGIRDLDAAVAMIDAGAERIGTSNGVAIAIQAHQGGLSAATE